MLQSILIFLIGYAHLSRCRAGRRPTYRVRHEWSSCPFEWQWTRARRRASVCVPCPATARSETSRLSAAAVRGPRRVGRGRERVCRRRLGLLSEQHAPVARRRGRGLRHDAIRGPEASLHRAQAAATPAQLNAAAASSSWRCLHLVSSCLCQSSESVRLSCRHSPFNNDALQYAPNGRAVSAASIHALHVAQRGWDGLGWRRRSPRGGRCRVEQPSAGWAQREHHLRWLARVCARQRLVRSPSGIGVGISAASASASSAAVPGVVSDTGPDRATSEVLYEMASAVSMPRSSHGMQSASTTSAAVGSSGTPHAGLLGAVDLDPDEVQITFEERGRPPVVDLTSRGLRDSLEWLDGTHNISVHICLWFAGGACVTSRYRFCLPKASVCFLVTRKLYCQMSIAARNVIWMFGNLSSNE